MGWVPRGGPVGGAYTWAAWRLQVTLPARWGSGQLYSLLSALRDPRCGAWEFEVLGQSGAGAVKALRPESPEEGQAAPIPALLGDPSWAEPLRQD